MWRLLPSSRRSSVQAPAALRLVLALAAVLTLAGGPTTAGEPGSRPGAARPVAAAVTPSVAGSISGLPVPRDRRAPDSRPAPQLELTGQVQAVLDTQAAALLAGDEAGFLAPADPVESALVAELRRRFAALRRMHVAGWEETVYGLPTSTSAGTERQWRIGVRLTYCFVVAGCDPVPVLVETRWAVRAGTLRLVFFGTSDVGEPGPRPWEVTDLRVAVGTRVLLAAPVRYAARLPAVLSAAEGAAAVADRYSAWAAPPGRYLVFLAGPDEWRRWYGQSQPGWVAGYAMPVAEHTTEIVMNGQALADADVPDTLRHEFTHVVTLAGVRRGATQPWWLVEGIAEYVRMIDRPLSEYRGLAPTRRFVLSGQWSGEVALGEPPQNVAIDEAGGRYGVALLAVRRLAERFGEARMLAFFDAVVRHGVEQNSAALAQFGVPLTELTDDCAQYVRTAVG
jgi:hypothetical protein